MGKKNKQRVNPGGCCKAQQNAAQGFRLKRADKRLNNNAWRYKKQHNIGYAADSGAVQYFNLCENNAEQNQNQQNNNLLRNP